MNTDPDNARCSTCGDFVDNRAMCVDDPGHETGWKRCIVCFNWESGAVKDFCSACGGAEILPKPSEAN